MTPVRTTTRRMKAKTSVEHKYSTLEIELLKSANNFLGVLSNFLATLATEQTYGVSCCSRCFREIDYYPSEAEFKAHGELCLPCEAKRDMGRKISSYIMPKVKTVGGMAALGSYWNVGSPE